MSLVCGLNHVSVLVSDTQQALAFYRRVLGLLPVERPALAYPGAWLDLGNGQQLHLLELTVSGGHDVSRHGGRDSHLALDVTDLDAVIDALQRAAIDYTMSRSGRRALFCRDPDGNALELVESACDRSAADGDGGGAAS